MRLIIALMFLIQAQVRAVPEDLPTPPEALARARLLHSAFDGALRVMHRDFFRKGDSKAIPSESLKDVFKAMEESHGVTIRWLATAATAMNVENKAKDDFESEALKTITKGGKEVSKISQGTLRYVGSISLQNQCLKCHASDRTSLEDRFAALEISLPVRSIAAPPAP